MTERMDRALIVTDDEPLIGIPFGVNGHEVVRYFTSEEAADAAVREAQPPVSRAVAGVWADLDADEVLDALDRLRHSSVPTPPMEL